jgi:hypothetical protein
MSRYLFLFLIQNSIYHKRTLTAIGYWRTGLAWAGVYLRGQLAGNRQQKHGLTYYEFKFDPKSHLPWPYLYVVIESAISVAYLKAERTLRPINFVYGSDLRRDRLFK